ncbi:CBS domain-containing protein [Azospirillum picis]|uniref:CBS-domain-containing membrane protein n=1 Tax=Azospirillum picis TaxID=488438 RepID=A0ABU0MMK1_9PROT|nr:CBS domain-containing protein [Azospirillum picis]MBP2300734.1 CBS-domain-containing membrane protein [Azospirillum picis]MDQ0534703.1 CBS-domain-containing membrane protein [Azospirillum picis]
MKAVEVMTRPVITIAAEESVDRAVDLMLTHRISGLPVVDAQGRLTGIVTEGDFLRRVEPAAGPQRPRWLEFVLGAGRLADDYVLVHGRHVADVMTRQVVSVTEETPLKEVAALLMDRRIKRLPVLRDGMVVGIVSRSDLLRTVTRKAADVLSGAEADARIRDGLLAELKTQRWTPASTLVVTVQDGVVDLRGVVFDDRQRRALRVAAESIPGVRGVVDHLTWVEPNSGVVVADDDRGDGEAAADRAG